MQHFLNIRQYRKPVVRRFLAGKSRTCEEQDRSERTGLHEKPDPLPSGAPIPHKNGLHSRHQGKVADFGNNIECLDLLAIRTKEAHLNRMIWISLPFSSLNWISASWDFPWRCDHREPKKETITHTRDDVMRNILSFRNFQCCIAAFPANLPSPKLPPAKAKEKRRTDRKEPPKSSGRFALKHRPQSPNENWGRKISPGIVSVCVSVCCQPPGGSLPPIRRADCQRG